MKKIKKLLMFSLILVCGIYFVLKTGAVVSTYASNEEEVITNTEQVDLTKSNSEYRDYVTEQKQYHDENYPALAGNYYPTDEGSNKGYKVSLKFEDSEKSFPYKQSETETINFTVEVPETGFYNFYMEYTTVDSYKSSIERTLAIDGVVPFVGADTLTFSRAWIDNRDGFDENGYFLTDTRGNERKPQQIEPFDVDPSDPNYESLKSKGECQSYFKDYMGYETAPYEFYLKQGTHTISFEPNKEAVQIDSLNLVSVEKAKSYAEYYEELKNKKTDIKDISIVTQGENASRKSSPTLYPTTDRSSSKTQSKRGHSYTKTYLNAIGGNSWKVLGDWIEWEFEIKEAGFYNISMRAKQNMVRGMYSSRIVYIDGEVLFEELNDAQFAYQGDWQNVTLGNSKDGDYLFYFEPGVHTVRMEVTLGKYSTLIERLQETVNLLNKSYREIISYTTVSPDANRDFELKKRFPNLMKEFRAYADELTAISNEITEISGTKSDKTGVIDSVVIQLEDFLKDELESVHKRLSSFSNNISSLGTLLNSLRELPLMIDYISVHTPDVELEEANEGFFRGLWDGIVSFFLSFFIDYSSISETEVQSGNKRELEVWMTLGRDQANVIRNLIDTDFSKKHPDIKVELKLTAGDVLLKSTLAGIGPDVALNVDSSLPVNYALRNAVLDLSKYIYELNSDGSFKLATTYFYNENGTPKKDEDGNYITRELPIVNNPDYAFVWNGETYEEAIVRRNYEIMNMEFDSKTGKYVGSYIDGFDENTIPLNAPSLTQINADIQTNNENAKFVIPDNFYMESSLSQFQFYYDTYSDDSRNKTTGTYALPEKQIFLMMFVRDDIMDEKGISAQYDFDKMSWDDVIDLVAELQTDQLQFYLPVNDAGASALNPIFLTLLYQRGGQLYLTGNKESGLNTPEAMDAFEQWTEFYTLYSFPKSASFANRFRTGEMPIGISYYELYNTLSVFAPELKGKWSFHMIPGTYNEEGELVQTATASGSACVVMKQPDSNKNKEQTIKDSFDFATWWSSYDAQVSFGVEMEGILGSAGRHTTANVKALNALAWPKDDLNILMRQWEQSCEIAQVAGSYITGREMENAYRSVINNLYNPREVLFEYAEKINLEIDRKRKEFDLEIRK